MKKFFIVLFVALIIMQFFQIEKTNPPVNQEIDFLTIKNTPENIATKIKDACYDCHSNETQYPWYTNVQPIAWFIKSHIKEGRKHLNFSEFATYETKKQAHKMEECVEMIEKGEMPMESFVMMHPEAKLTDADRKMLIDYFKEIETATNTSSPNTGEPSVETEE